MLFTSEQVSNGHPDKICDQISDAIVTDCLLNDRNRIEYTEVRNFAQGEEEWASHRDSATMDVA